MVKLERKENDEPHGFKVLERNGGVCEVEKDVGQCDEPAAVEVDYGGPEANLKLCWGCYYAIKVANWPDLTELRRQAGWDV